MDDAESKQMMKNLRGAVAGKKDKPAKAAPAATPAGKRPVPPQFLKNKK